MFPRVKQKNESGKRIARKTSYAVKGVERKKKHSPERMKIVEIERERYKNIL